jgi:hypothetical protein
MSLIIEIAPQAADFILEGIAMRNFFQSEDYWWLAFTLVPICLPGISLAALSISVKEEWSKVLWDGIAFPISSIWE